MKIKELEDKLEVALPSQYRALLINYPTEFRGIVERRELLSCPERVFAENDAARKQLVAGKPWPLHMVVVGGDGAGNLHVLDNRTEPAGVWLYRQEEQSFSMIATSLSHWFPKLHCKAIESDE
jgi:hypothetical protein